MKRKQITLIAMVILMAGCIYYLCAYFRYNNKSEAEKLFVLNDLRLRTKAFYTNTKGSQAFEFEDSSGSQFRIDGVYYSSILNINKVSDLFSYHYTRLSVYTDEEGYAAYKEKNKSTIIHVKQFQLNGEDQISQTLVNFKKEKIAKERYILIAALLFIAQITLLTRFPHRTSGKTPANLKNP